jgi:hypothetical protein
MCSLPGNAWATCVAPIRTRAGKDYARWPPRCLPRSPRPLDGWLERGAAGAPLVGGQQPTGVDK